MTSLREVAAEAGISIGAVQHKFGTKGHLIDAVEVHVRGVMEELFTPDPDTTDGSKSVDGVGERVKRLITHYPDVAGYVARSITDDTAFGASIFDTLVRLGRVRWQRRAMQGLLRDDVDWAWANLNAVLLGIAGVSMRAHLDRHLPRSFLSEEMQSQWVASVNSLIREGYLVRGETPGQRIESPVGG